MDNGEWISSIVVENDDDGWFFIHKQQVKN
jgi:hypothetical protein